MSFPVQHRHSGQQKADKDIRRYTYSFYLHCIPCGPRSTRLRDNASILRSGPFNKWANGRNEKYLLKSHLFSARCWKHFHISCKKQQLMITRKITLYFLNWIWTLFCARFTNASLSNKQKINAMWRLYWRQCLSTKLSVCRRRIKILQDR